MTRSCRISSVLPALATWVFLLLTGASFAAVDATLSSGSISSTSTPPLTVNVTGLTTGATVLVERYSDTTGNGSIGADDILCQSFTITDGAVFSIAGVRDSHVPGDEDGVANGQMAVHLGIGNGPEIGRLAAAYLVRVSSPSVAFSPIIRTLSITNPSQGQVVSGSVSNGASPIPYARVFLLQAQGEDDEFVAGASADASGNYSIPVAPGQYVALGLAPNYVSSFNTGSANVAGGVGTIKNLTLTAATRTLSGKIADAASPFTGLPGVQLFFGSEDGLVTVGSTDASGNYSASVTAGMWEVEINSNSLIDLGYVPLQSGTGADTAIANPTVVNASFPKVTALVVGHVTAPGGTAFAGAEVFVDVQGLNNHGGFTTDANGYYVAGVAAGSVSARVSTDNLPGYISSNSPSFSLSTGQAATADFTLQAVTAHITGHVQTTALSFVSNASIYGTAHVGNTDLVTNTQTDIDGNYVLPVLNGTWEVSVYSQDSGQAPSQSAVVNGAPGPILNFTLSHAPFISYQPTDQYVSVGQTFVFSIGTSVPNQTFQWQVSTNGGMSWTNLAEGAPYSTVTSNVLNVTAQGGMNGYKFRCVTATVAYPTETATSNSATLYFLATYTSFQSQYFTVGEQGNPAISGPNADPDKDGVSNLLEFAFNLNPRVASINSLPIVGQSVDHLTLSYVRRKDAASLVYVVEAADELGFWHDGPSYVEQVSVTPLTGQTELVTFRRVSTISGNAHSFMRLKVTDG